VFIPGVKSSRIPNLHIPNSALTKIPPDRAAAGAGLAHAAAVYTHLLAKQVRARKNKVIF